MGGFERVGGWVERMAGDGGGWLGTAGWMVRRIVATMSTLPPPPPPQPQPFPGAPVPPPPPAPQYAPAVVAPKSRGRKGVLAIGLVGLVVVGVVVWLVVGRDSGSDANGGGAAIDTTQALAGLASVTEGNTEPTSVDDCPLGDFPKLVTLLSEKTSLDRFQDGTDANFVLAEFDKFTGIVGCATGDQSGNSGTDLGVTAFGGSNKDVIRLQETSRADVQLSNEGKSSWRGGTVRSGCLPAAGDALPECLSWWDSDGLVVIVNLRVENTSAAATGHALRGMLDDVIAALEAAA